MRNFAKLLGIAVIAAVIGFSMTACGEEEEEKEKEKEKDTVVRFDSALYGNWLAANNYRVSFSTSPYDGDAVIFSTPSTNGSGLILIAKNGNTYTVKSPYHGDESNFTAMVGSDGKLTISGRSEDYDNYNTTYTKQAEF